LHYIKDWFLGIKHSAKGAIAPTIVAALIFMITYRFFGVENSMIAPFATLSYMRFTRLNHNLDCMFKHVMIYMIMAVLAFIACINLPLCIIVNALGLFWIAYLLIDEYQPNNYFASGMALMFFQLAPTEGLSGLGMRIGALAVSFVVIFLFVVIPMVLGFGKKKETLSDMISRGFENCKKQLAMAEADIAKGILTPEDVSARQALRDELDRINQQCSMEIYAYNRSAILPRGKTSWYCRFILVFQVLNYLLITQDRPGHVEEARSLLDLFEEMFRTEKPKADYKKLRVRVNKPDIRNFRFRFALRLVLIVTPCIAFAYQSGFDNAYWLVISVFFMMIPYSDETGSRVKQRVTGTICGLVICFVLFTIFPGFSAHVVIMMIANFLIYSASGYGAMVSYITCSALAVQTVDILLLPVLGERLLYTLIGAAIALLANRFVFPIRARKQMDFLEEMLGRIRHKLGLFSPEDPDADPDRIVYLMQPGGFVKKEKASRLDEECIRHQVDQLIIKSYLISYRLKTLNATLPPEQQIKDLEARKHRYMIFMASLLRRQFRNA
jgi:hypothetical protein